MALRKQTTLPNSVTGNYVRLTAYRWDRSTKEASAHFHLYASAAAAAAAPSSPLCLIAVLRLSGAKFDEYLAPSILDTLGRNAIQQLYLAVRNEPLIAGGGLTEMRLDDAQDV